MSAFKDVVILLPGITGSVLASGGTELWSPTTGSIWRAVTSFGGSIDALKLDASGQAGNITASRLIPDVSIVPGLMKLDGYTRIEEYLIASLGLERKKNYFPFPYDWRLDNRINAARLETSASAWLKAWQQDSNAPDARLVLIGHSMGGLVSRYFLECLDGWKQTRMLITLGTPHQGSLNAVDSLVNGMKKGIGPLGFDLAPLLRSFPSVHQLLPIYRCIDSGNGDLVKVADAASSGILSNVDEALARDALKFHREIEDAQRDNAKTAEYAKNGYDLIPLVGIEQPTYQSARVVAKGVEMLRTLAGKVDAGDGTVPRASATPIELETERREVYAAEMHGSLQNADGTLANIKGLLTSTIDLSKLRAAPSLVGLSLDVDDVVLPGEPLRVRARSSQGNPKIRAVLTRMEPGIPDVSFTETLGKSPTDDWRQSEFAVTPGTWRVRVETDNTTPVTDLVVVAES